MIDTVTETRAELVTALHELVEARLALLEARTRRDLLESGPEDEAALDLPPDPHSDWRRCTVEEVLMVERERLEAWAADRLARFDVVSA